MTDFVNILTRQGNNTIGSHSCQYLVGCLSICVETATRRYKSQEHLSPVDLDIPQVIRDMFQRLDLCIAAFSETIRRPVMKVV